MSHVCMGCGRDLARCRALIDPALRLHIVVCPACGRGCARRPVWLTRRDVLRRIAACRRLFRNLLVSVVLLLSVAGLSVGFSSGFGDWGTSVPYALVRGDLAPTLRRCTEGNAIFPVAAWLLMAFTAGVWLRAELGHRRQAGVWMVSLGLVAVVAFIDAVYAGVLGLLESALGGTGSLSGPAVDDLRLRGIALVLTFLVMAVGGGAGALWARTAPARAGARLRKRLARERKRRATT